MKWADKYRTLKVRTNADTPADAKRAREFGAEGIGLCRTEHMFFEGERIQAMREMILADNDQGSPQRPSRSCCRSSGRTSIGIFKAMKGLPVTIRLLDPPLHEFLPHDAKSQAEMAKQLGVTAADVKARVDAAARDEPDARPPRLPPGRHLSGDPRDAGHGRSSRRPSTARRRRSTRIAEIMIPLVGTATELEVLVDQVRATIDEVKEDKKYKGKLDILVGTMIEIPRAALTADEIAEIADFFSFGTNDLTQMTFGYSRDDINTFLPDYLKQELLLRDPFQSLDTTGVGQLVEMGVSKGRSARKDLKCGICGEHGGDPASIDFCHKVGLDYVSCCPFRVPIARLAAAQAAIESSKK